MAAIQRVGNWGAHGRVPNSFKEVNNVQDGAIPAPGSASLGVGCGHEDRADQKRYENANPTGTNGRVGETATDPTNTAVNERDRSQSNPTPTDQPADERDMMLTQSIRKAIMDDQSLSMMAKNVKIITVDGKVTLRGPVKSEAEKAAIAAKAEQFAVRLRWTTSSRSLRVDSSRRPAD